MSDTKKIKIGGNAEGGVFSQINFAKKSLAGDYREFEKNKSGYQGLSLAEQMLKNPEKISGENKGVQQDIEEMVQKSQKKTDEKEKKYEELKKDRNFLAPSQKRVFLEQVKTVAGESGMDISDMRFSEYQLQKLYREIQKKKSQNKQKTTNPYRIDQENIFKFLQNQLEEGEKNKGAIKLTQVEKAKTGGARFAGGGRRGKKTKKTGSMFKKGLAFAGGFTTFLWAFS